MRTNVTLDDDVHQLASIYASAKGITLGAAISELIRKAEATPQPPPDSQVGQRSCHVSTYRQGAYCADGKRGRE
jgi:hypothetical protein